MADKQWYVVRVQSGREDKVKESLEKRVRAAGLEAFVTQVIVPSEKISEIKAGKKTVRERKVYPGYLMIEMEMNEKAWFLVRETPGIGDFLGTDAPSPMEPHEVAKMLNASLETPEKPTQKIEFKKGDSVRIKEGPFENFDGVVQEVIPEKGLVNLIVTIFGRATPVQLEYWQIEAV
ncbi:MAG: transcription termination/antitermination factor NusG [Planctomycetes bacterium]|nr:transcription termination/antitermination factor NusG [Planctomycetota bacterium]